MKSILKKITVPVFALALIGLALNGCKKEATDLETQTVVDNTIAENEFGAIAPIVNERGIKSTGVRGCENCNVSGRLLKNGAIQLNDTIIEEDTISVTINPDSSRTMIIKFGPKVKKDGMFRTGKLIAKFDKAMYHKDVNMTITFDNYTCKGIKYNGTIKVNKTTSGNLITFTVQVIDGTCTKDGTNGWTINYACNFTTTRDLTTPLFNLYGTSNGTNRTGTKFTVKIDKANALVKSLSCQWVSSGIYELKTDKGTKKIDYGNGTCDNKATLTVGKNVSEITLD